ncbi:WD40-repeat-containing domain protein [Lactarius hengduanensis]|nr:WD40-repeat-containing domain protein [Lactarius hengduanensis]
MSHRLEYQERFNRLAHESVINAMVVSPDGRWLVTGSDDSTVLVWSSRSSVALCRFKTHSPVLSLAWVESSKGFIFGCKNGMLASVNITECRSPLYIPELQHFPNIGGQGRRQDLESPGTDRSASYFVQSRAGSLKLKLPPPRTIDFRREVEVTSVNWENQNAAAIASFAVVSYKWHGIMCWDVTNVTVLWQLPMKDCGTLSLSPNGSLQPPTACPKLSKNQPVCFAHEGFAVVGAASHTEVYVWDTERGDQLLSLNHGDGSTIHTLATAFSKEDDQFVIATCTEKRGKFYIFVWATVPCDVKTASTSSAYDIGGNQNELFTRKFWINVAFLAVLVALLSWWIMYLYASATVTAAAYLATYMTNFD